MIAPFRLARFLFVTRNIAVILVVPVPIRLRRWVEELELSRLFIDLEVGVLKDGTESIVLEETRLVSQLVCLSLPLPPLVLIFSIFVVDDTCLFLLLTFFDLTQLLRETLVDLDTRFESSFRGRSLLGSSDTRFLFGREFVSNELVSVFGVGKGVRDRFRFRVESQVDEVSVHVRFESVGTDEVSEVETTTESGSG